jgi:DNA replication protein DnaC
MSDTPQVLLAHHLKALRLPTFLREYDKLARQCAAEGVDHTRYLLRLTELEMIDRERRIIERRIKEARFPAVKSLDSFDFAAIPSLNKTLVLELARSEYVARRENIIAVGNSGTGKTHVALGLGLAACQKGLAVGFTTAAALVNELHEARDEKRLLRLQRQLAGYKLLIVDELGYVPLSPTGAELLFETFSQRYERGSIIDAVAEYRDPVADAAPLADQHGARRNTLIRNTLSAHISAPLTNTVEEPLRRWLQPAIPLLLQPVRDCPDHEDACEERGRVSTE